MDAKALGERPSVARLGIGCLVLAAALVIAAVVLGGLFLTWASDDSAVFTPQLFGTAACVVIAAAGAAIAVGVGIPRSVLAFVVCIGAGALFGLFVSTWMRPLVLETCQRGTGPQPIWCRSDAAMSEHVRSLPIQYVTAGVGLGLLTAVVGLARGPRVDASGPEGARD